MKPAELLPFASQIVDIHFADGMRLRGHIVSIDADSFENHLAYKVLAIPEPGPPRAKPLRIGEYLASSARDIAALVPTDGVRHLKVDVPDEARRPWWKLW